MVTVPTDAEVTGVVAMPTAALPEEAVASMAANPAAAVSTVAAVTLPEATVPEVTVAEATVADTGKNSRHGEVSTAGSTALPAIFFSRCQPPHPDLHFSSQPGSPGPVAWMDFYRRCRNVAQTCRHSAARRSIAGSVVMIRTI